MHALSLFKLNHGDLVVDTNVSYSSYLLTLKLYSIKLAHYFTFIAVAFAPMARSPRSSLKMSYENEIGALPPTGFWDPLGLSKDIDAATFRNYREAELKHGRVAQLAVIGYLVQESYRLPGAIDLDGTTFASIPNGVAAIGAVSSLGWLQIVASIGYWELVGWEDRKGYSNIIPLLTHFNSRTIAYYR